jgi:hypothetical protein
MLRVGPGKGVKVAVGGNQTIVAVGVSLAVGVVRLIWGGMRSVGGRQAIKPTRQNILRPAHIIKRTILVYYGKIILSEYHFII